MSQSVAATPSELPDTIAGLLTRMMKELQCPICLQPITEATSTPCGHTFCRACIQRWLKYHAQCPCCVAKLHRRVLYESESIDRIVTEFGKLRQAYEDETHQDLSLVVPEQYEKEWRQEPESNLSLQYPYPTKSAESATYDSEVTHVTSLEIRQAQETHARFEPIEEQQRKKNKTISLDSPTIAVSSRINDVRVLQIMPLLMHQMGAQKVSLVTQETTFVLVYTDKSLCVVEDDFTYLQAMCLGKPVISTQWVLECYNQKDILPVEPYRVVGSTSNNSQHGREGLPRLFEGQDFYLDGVFHNSSKEELMTLITCGGGRVVTSHDESVQIICPDNKTSSCTSHGQEQEAGAISQQWILDCISARKVLDRKLYYVA